MGDDAAMLSTIMILKVSLSLAGMSDSRAIFAQEGHESEEEAAAHAKQQLDNQLASLKYSDGTSEVKSIKIQKANHDRIFVLVTLNKPEQTKDLRQKLPATLHGIPIYLSYPPNNKPVYGATFG